MKATARRRAGPTPTPEEKAVDIDGFRLDGDLSKSCHFHKALGVKQGTMKLTDLESAIAAAKQLKRAAGGAHGGGAAAGGERDRKAEASRRGSVGANAVLIDLRAECKEAEALHSSTADEVCIDVATATSRKRQMREYELGQSVKLEQESAHRREFASDHNFLGATPLTVDEVRDVQALWGEAARVRQVAMHKTECARQRNLAFGAHSTVALRATVPCPGDIAGAMRASSPRSGTRRAKEGDGPETEEMETEQRWPPFTPQWDPFCKSNDGLWAKRKNVLQRLKQAVAVALARRRARLRLEKLRAALGTSGDAAAAVAAATKRIDLAHGVGDGGVVDESPVFAISPTLFPRCVSSAAGDTTSRAPVAVAPLRAPKRFPFFSLQKLPEFMSCGYREFSLAPVPCYASIESARDLRIGAGDELMAIYSTPVGNHETAGTVAANAIRANAKEKADALKAGAKEADEKAMEREAAATAGGAEATAAAVEVGAAEGAMGGAVSGAVGGAAHVSIVAHVGGRPVPPVALMQPTVRRYMRMPLRTETDVTRVSFCVLLPHPFSHRV